MRISAFRSALASALAILAGAVLGWPAQEGLAQSIDAGTLTILRDGRMIGREDFTVRRGPAAGPAFTITSTAAYPAVRPEVTVTVTLELGPDSMAAAAQFDVQGHDERRIYAVFGARRVTLRGVRRGREAAREFPGVSRRLVVDDSVFALQALLLRDLGAEATAFAPRSERRSPVTVRWLGDDRTTIAGVVHTLRRAVVRIGEHPRHLWFDAAGRLMRVEDFATGLVAERQEIPR